MEPKPAKRRKTSHIPQFKRTNWGISPLHAEFIYAKNVDNSAGVTKPAKPEIVATLNAGY